MFFKELSVQNFRNLATQKIDLDQRINVIIGENAQGKTTLLESVYFMVRGRSFKEKTDANLINWSQDSAVIQATVSDGVRSLDPSVVFQKDKTTFYIDGKVKKAKGLAAYEPISVVVFLPEDLELVKGSPDNRRNYIDNILSNIWIKQKVNRINYFKTLKQRNFFLKSGSLKGIDVWDAQLAKYGSILIKQRLVVLEVLSGLLKSIHKELVNVKEEIRLSYRSSFIEDLEKINDCASVEENFLKALRANRESDYRYQTTLTGPHKDDITIFINDKNSREYSSQGQQRTVAIGLRIAEWEIYKQESNVNSILLLDDIFSELDKSRRENLLTFILEKEQTFITSVNSDFIKNEALSSINILRTENGVFYG